MMNVARVSIVQNNAVLGCGARKTGGGGGAIVSAPEEFNF